MPQKVISRYRKIQSDRLRVVEGHETLQLLLDADVMLCDTSSIITEFAVLRKPVVTFRNLSPQPHMVNVNQAAGIGPALEQALSRPDALMRAIERHVLETHPRNDGRCSERIIAATDSLVARGLGHLRPKPPNLRRHLSMRRQLHYYRFH